MTEPAFPDDPHTLEPVHSDQGDRHVLPWTERLVLFLRIMAVISLFKGLYHWAQVTGIFVKPEDAFEMRSIAWQASTIFFAVIDLVAAIGLWLAAAWGAVIWLTSLVSMIALDLFFPQVFEVGFAFDIAELAFLLIYLWLALKSAQEHPA